MQAPTVHQGGQAGHRRDDRVLALKFFGLLCSGGPLVLLLMFAFGEGVGEEGWGHLLQAVPLAVLLVLAWWRPLVGGVLITVVGTTLGVVYAVTASGNAWWLMTAAMFFAPAVVGGLLLTAAGVLAARHAAPG